MRYRYGATDVYMLPGGNPDPGENLREALQRELHEELGIEAVAGQLVLCGEVLGWRGKEDTLHCVFEVTDSTGPARLNPDHTSAVAVAWLPVAELGTKVLYPQVGEALAEYLRGGLASVHIGTIEQPYVD
jgi:8-oxo-dGTP pyrophosphatase MutT (NUDIX family)